MEPVMLRDAQGYEAAGATREAIALYDQAVRCHGLAHGDLLGLYDAARAAAPAFVMPILGKAWAFAMARDPMLARRAGELIESAATVPMGEREAGHLAALRDTTSGDLEAAVLILDRHLMRFPRDILAHEMALFLDLYLGRPRWMRDRIARALPLWSAETPNHAALMSFHAFGCEENGDYARAEEESRAVLEREPASHFAHHTVSHVMEMTGRPEDGLGWMAAREASWASAEHPNQVHLWWHRALFHLELGQFDQALALYDGPIRDTQRPLAVSMTNASALLWRLHTLGHDVSDRWAEVATLWDGHADGRCLAFSDLHAIMADLGAGREAAAEATLAAMRNTAAGSAVYREAGVPMAEGLIAFHRGAYEAAVAAMLPARFDLWRIGGSHAQRDVFDWTLTEAAVRGGLRDVALALANERLGARPRDFVNRDFLRRAERIA
jgi:tetratricopeptide (TPR) repeat protein